MPTLESDPGNLEAGQQPGDVLYVDPGRYPVIGISQTHLAIGLLGMWMEAQEHGYELN